MGKYAANTSVPIGRSQEAIRSLVLARGADGWMVGEEGDFGLVSFRLMGRVLRIRVKMSGDAKEDRRLWRALFMAIKAKLVIAAEGIETFDEVFLANIVVPGGGTVADELVPQVVRMIESGKGGRLLLGPGGQA